MSINTKKVPEIGFYHFEALQENAKRCLSKTVNIKKVDRKLAQRLAPIELLQKQETTLKVQTAALGMVPFFGWPFAILSWDESMEMQRQKRKLIQVELETMIMKQIEKDINRDFVIKVNGIEYNSPQDILDALNAAEISSLKKYTIMQLSSQALYATLLKAIFASSLKWCNENLPIDEYYYINMKHMNQDNSKQIIEIDLENDTVSSSIGFGGVINSGDIIPELNYSFSIKLNTGEMKIDATLCKVNMPLESRVR